MKKNLMLMSLGMIAAMSEQSYPSNPNEPIIRHERKPTNRKDKVIPKGVKEYWFKSDGSFLNENHDRQMFKSQIFFICFALNNKNAKRKFETYLKKLAQ